MQRRPRTHRPLAPWIAPSLLNPFGIAPTPMGLPDTAFPIPMPTPSAFAEDERATMVKPVPATPPTPPAFAEDQRNQGMSELDIKAAQNGYTPGIMGGPGQHELPPYGIPPTGGPLFPPVWTSAGNSGTQTPPIVPWPTGTGGPGTPVLSTSTGGVKPPRKYAVPAPNRRRQ
jgi:hypothetical protein